MGDARRYRRQFVLAPRPVGELSHWPATSLGAGRMLHAHPDLPVTHAEVDGLRLTLVGYAIDPHRPELDDAGVLDALARRACDAAGVPDAVAALGGRWVLVASDAERDLLLHDANGLRSVVHTTRDDGVWCASDTPLLGEVLPLVDDADAVELFVESAYYRTSPQPWWPGDATRYDGVRQLLPDHVLDLGAGTVRRFWPGAPLPERALPDAACDAAAILRGMTEGAARRFPLSAGLTAGLDSRLLLAASRSIAPTTDFFTQVHYEIKRSSPDVTVSERLAQEFALTHRVIDSLDVDTFLTSDDPRVAEHRAIYMSNTATPRAVFGAISVAVDDAIDDAQVLVKGNCNESTRRYYDWPRGAAAGSAEALCQVTGMAGNELSRRAYARWLDGATDVCERLGYDVLDVFYIEQRVARWQAADQLERDIDHETFVPFNSREYAEICLGVVEEHRRPPYGLHLAMIRELWPELLTVPINPVSLQMRAKAVAYGVASRLGVVDQLKRLLRR